jgi:4-amino-4-deoxy-L-arabinose transferase-like glycosyltransferase
VRADLKALLAAALVVYVAGIWWGVPWQWGPDELAPDYIFGAMDMRFAGGWHDKYPPMQYYLDALVLLPFMAAARLGWVTLGSLDTSETMLIAMRLLSVAMTIGTVAAIYLTATQLYGRRGAAAAALLAGFTPTVVFYAKLANVDAPSLFWVACALYFYVRSVRGGRPRDLLGYGLTAVSAIATKDQTAGFFVLPSVHVAWLAARRREWRPLVTAAVVSAIVLAFELGMPYNLEGFKSHVHVITGEASAPYRIPGSTWTRQTAVAGLTVAMLAWSMTWVGFAAGVAGLVNEVRRRRFLWLLLPAVSYYLFFLVIAGYVYDRFVIGLGFVLAIFAGGLIDDLLGAAVPWPRWRTAACAAAAAFVVWSGVSMDLMMILDSRYEAARWMSVRRGTGRVGLVGFPPYLPYIRGAVRLLSGPDDYPAADQPKFVIVNAEVMRREALPPLERAWKQWLESGRSPYVVAARFKTAPAVSMLTYTDAFRNGIEDTTTNLDKVGPEIVVYWRPGVLR